MDAPWSPADGDALAILRRLSCAEARTAACLGALPCGPRAGGQADQQIMEDARRNVAAEPIVRAVVKDVPLEALPRGKTSTVGANPYAPAKW